MKDPIKVKRADVAPLVLGSFPNYTGRKFKVVAEASASLHDLNWSGGSRSSYRFCTLAGEPVGSADRYQALAPWVNHAEGASFELPKGVVMVRHSIFSGKDMGLTISIRPDDMPKSLTAPVAV